MSDQVNVGQPIPTAIPHDGEGKITSRKSWSLAELQSMSANDYARNLTNPDFVAAVDAIPGRFEAKEEPSA